MDLTGIKELLCKAPTGMKKCCSIPKMKKIRHRYVESPPVGGAILSHLSGSTTKGDVHLAFHWVVPATDHDSGIYDVMQYEEEDPEYVDPSELASDEDDYYVPSEYFIP